MIEVKVRHQGDVKFEVAARQHILFSDQPAENGGSDEGMTPPELFLAGLGSCAAFYAAAYLKKKNLSREGLAVRVTAEKAGPPARIDPIHIDVEVSIPLTEAERAGLDDAVHRCLIHNTLAHPPKVRITLHTPVAA